MWTPKERSPIAQTWLWGQHPAECSRLSSRTWGRRAGRRGPALRPGGGGVSRARGPGRHFPACRAARTLGLSGPSGRPAPAHPVSPAARAWRPAEERRRLARYAVAWPGGQAGGRGLVAPGRHVREGASCRWGLRRPTRGTHPTGSG